MIRRSVREWDYLRIGDGETQISRQVANRLLAAARRAESTLRLGADAILVDRGSALRAGQVVGVLTAPGVALEILPKIDGIDEGATRLNCVRMLARTIGIKIADGSITQLGHQTYDLLEVLIGLYCDRLFAAIHHGLVRLYRDYDSDLLALRGRLNLRRQFTILAASPQWLACQYEDLSSDIALNQIFKAAVKRLRGISRAGKNQRRLIELDFAFADVTAVPIAALPWRRVVLDRTNTEYHDLLRLTRVLIGEQFQTTSVGNVLGFSLLFQMNVLFEEFVGRSLQRSLHARDFHVTLQGPQSFALSDVNGDNSRFATKPDIVIHKNGKPIMIIDTKWKRLKNVGDDPRRGVSQHDVYQMMAYGQIYNVNRLVLIYPHNSDLDCCGIQATQRIARTSDRLITVAAIDLSRFEAIDGHLLGLVEARLCAPDLMI